MKRLFAIVLMLCLAAACVPAAADPIWTELGPITIDLSQGSYTTVPGTETDGVAGSQYCLFVMLIKADTGDYYYEESVGDHEYSYYDLDKNGSWDLRIDFAKLFASEGVLVLDVHPDNSVSGSVTFDFPDDLEETWVNVRYNPITLIFPLNLPETYADATGSYAIDENGEAAFQKPAKAAASAKVPDTITVDGLAVPVTRIADNAFKGQKKLTKVIIGANIKEIGKNAFANCAKLKSVSGGANVEIIGDSAFAGCKALTKFTIGAKVNKIGKKAFNKCAALKKITIKSKLLTAKTVGSAAFKGINASATIKVPKAVKKDYTKWLLKKGVKKTMKIK